MVEVVELVVVEEVVVVVVVEVVVVEEIVEVTPKQVIYFFFRNFTFTLLLTFTNIYCTYDIYI